MALEMFDGKHVTIITYDGRIFYGFVDAYFSAEDNESGEESIVLEVADSELIEFTNDDIEKIMI